MIVVDTNVIAYFFLSGQFSEQAERVMEVDSDWRVPTLWRSEFMNVLSQYLRQELIQPEDMHQVMRWAEVTLSDAECQVSSFGVLSLVAQSRLSAYDCEFVALAEYLSVPLVTADQKIIQQFPQIAQSIDAFIASHSI